MTDASYAIYYGVEETIFDAVNSFYDISQTVFNTFIDCVFEAFSQLGDILLYTVYFLIAPYITLVTLCCFYQFVMTTVKRIAERENQN